MDHLQDIEEYLEAQPALVQRSVKIVTKADLGVEHLLHISTNPKIKKFAPQIGRRQAPTENRTVPRVCTAPTLMGCFIGYQTYRHQLLDLPVNVKDSDWLGGWHIYGFEFEAALSPTTKMVYDQKVGDEQWLVAYNAETAEYVPVTMGKVFIRSINVVIKEGSYPVKELELYLEVKSEHGLNFSKNIHLEKGYYRITGPDFMEMKSWKDDRAYSVETIDRETYESLKKATADMLSLDAVKPNFMKW